ncbi:unnamed protein product, partial [Timema podura]|nr:unnamed protein product [Timema podura]
MTAVIDTVLSAMSTVTFLILPVVTYLLFFRSKTEHRKLYAHYSIPGWNFHLKRWWAYFKLYYLSQSDHCVSEDQDQILPSKEEERMEAPKKLNREEAGAGMESLEPRLLEVALTFAVHLQWVEDWNVDIECISTHLHNIDVSCQK